MINLGLPSDAHNVPKTTEELKTINTFEGWDIGEGVDNTKTWSIRSGYTYPWLNKMEKPEGGNLSEVVLTTGVSINKDSITLRIKSDGTGESEELYADVQPSNASNKIVLWTSKNSDIATVDESGKATAVSEGKAVITARTMDGDYTDTCEVIVLPSANPQVPQNMRAKSTGVDIVVMWDEVTGATSYEIEVDGEVYTATETLYNHTELKLGTIHNYRVRAVNEFGVSEWSEILSKTVETIEELEIPNNIKLEPTRTSIKITWDDVDGASGYDIETYGMEIDNGGSTEYIHTGLSPNTQHAYRIRAKNENTEGPWSEYIAGTTLTGIPENIHVDAMDKAITLSWDAVSGATGYDIEIDGEKIVETTEISYIHKDIDPNTKHTYRIRSKSVEGISDWSELVSNITLLPVPENISAIVNSKGILLSWEAVSNASGYDIEVDGKVLDNDNSTSFLHEGVEDNSKHIYRIRAKNEKTVGLWSEEIVKIAQPTADIYIEAVATTTDITVSWNIIAGAIGYDIEVDGEIIDNELKTIYIHKGLEPNTQHTYRVRVKNEGGPGEWSEPVVINTKAEKPLDISVIATSTTIKVTWNEVSGATGYEILVDGVLIDNGTNTTYIHTELEPNTLHVYRVKARLQDSGSEWSDTLKQFTMVGVPTNISVEAQNTQISIKWDDVEAATGYEIEVDGVIVDNGLVNTYVHEGLIANSWHTYRIRAKNENGNGDWTELIQQIAAPSMDLNLRATATPNEINVLWDPVEEAVAYDIEVDGNVIENIKETTYLHEGLKPNTRHIYRVRVKNEGAVSEWSEKLEQNTIPEVEINVGMDNQFNFVIVAPEKEDIETRRITVHYNAEELEVIDLCAITPEIENQTGAIKGTDITVEKYTPGEITFKVNNADKTIVNSIKFKAKTNNHSKVNYVVE